MRNGTLKFCAMLLAICTSAIHLQAMDEWDGNSVAQGFYSGTGTKADPFRIFTASQFLYFIQQTRDGNTFNGQYIELCNDVAFKTNEGLADGGDFYGDFEGNDHTIQVNKYADGIDGYLLYGWTLFNLYGSMHDVLFVRANEVMTIYTEGILYNCKFEFPNGAYHREWTVSLKGGTIANCVSDAASSYQNLDSKVAQGFVDRYTLQGYCLNCYFPIESKEYNGYTVCENYYGTIENCGEKAGNDWVQSHTEYVYKSWPLTFNPTYPEYQIKEQPQTYNPSVVCPNPNDALYQWCYQEKMPMTFEDITFSSSTQTKDIVVPYDNMVLSFDFKAKGYSSSSYNGDSYPAWISINGEKIVNTYDERAATYSCQLTAGTCEISCERSDITNIRLAYPTETLTNETSSVLSKQTIMEKSGIYFCQVSYGEGCDVMNSDYVDYEKLLTIDNVTYVINEDATATVLWADDMAVDITIYETVNYDEVDYPVTSISSKAFVDCTSLASIGCNTSDVPALLGGSTFEGLISSNITLDVPAGRESTYSTVEGWNEFTIASDIVEYKNTLLVENQDARAGTQVELSIALKNNVNITNFQFDLVLPEGVTIAHDEDGYDLIDLSTVRTTARKHTIGNELQNDGSMRVICYSSSNAVFSGTEGEVMTIKLNISKSLSEGEYSIQLKNLVLTEYTDGSAIKHTIPCIESKINVYVYTPGDVNDDGSIDVTDISGVVNFILNTATDGLIERAADVNEDGAVDVTDISGVVNMILNVSASKTSFSRGLLRTSAVESTDNIRMTVLPFTLEAGEEKEVQILLDNPNDAFTGVQFDLYLPEGVSVAMDDEGYYYVDLGSRTNNRNHVLPECSLLEDGGLRVVCYSNSNKTFKNEEGDILVLTIVGDENLSEGVCELSIENIVLSRPDVTNNKPSDYVASILSGDGGAIPALVLHGVYTADVLDDFSTTLATNKIVTSIDLTEAVSVDDSGVLTTGNPNTLIYLSENEVLANESNVVCGGECDNLVLTDGYAFSTPVSFEALQATYTRTLSNMKWNALYLPFDISVDALENCNIASFTTMNLHDDNSVTMTATINEAGTLHANTACLIRMKSGVEELCVTENNVTVWAEQNTESYTNGSKKASVTGVYSETIASEIAGAYAMSDGALKQAADENQKLNPFRFYLLLTDNDVPVQVSALKSIGINVDGDGTSSISPVQSTIDESHVVYDLQGRRVDVPSKGVYIVNGKKVVY